MMSTEVSDTPATSRWYGQGRAADVTRRLESLMTLAPPPPPAGVVTARRDEVTVTFVGPLKSPLPHPWRPAETNTESRIPWESANPGTEPDPDHPVYLAVLGTTADEGLVGLNLAAFGRLRITGDAAIAVAVVARWILELLATHPNITIGVTGDVWRGPLTTRVQRVDIGHVPPVDVLVCGPDLTYSDRAQIVSRATSPIMIDLGKDAAVDTKWTITCSADRSAQISNGTTSPMAATLILPTEPVLDRCQDLMTSPPATPDALPGPADDATPASITYLDDPFEPTTSPPEDDAEVLDDAALTEAPGESSDEDAAPIDFFAPATTSTEPAPIEDEQDDWASSPASAANPAHTDLPPAESADPVRSFTEEPAAAPRPAQPDAEATAADVDDDEAAPPPAAAQTSAEPLQVAPIWNRILGQVSLAPPHSTQEPGVREKRLNELTVYLQHNPWASTDDIIRCVYGGAASDKTVTQQISLLRARLGAVRLGGPKALPTMQDGGYRLDNAVRSDWMEFERLVEIIIETTPTSHLAAAMDLVTGPPLGGIPTKEWTWTKDLRAELSDRVGAVAAALARRLLEAKQFSAAVEIARKGLWYDSVRQDLWQTGLHAALDGHDSDTFKMLRGQYFNAVTGDDRDPAVLELAKQAG